MRAAVLLSIYTRFPKMTSAGMSTSRAKARPSAAHMSLPYASARAGLRRPRGFGSEVPRAENAHANDAWCSPPAQINTSTSTWAWAWAWLTFDRRRRSKDTRYRERKRRRLILLSHEWLVQPPGGVALFLNGLIIRPHGGNELRGQCQCKTLSRVVDTRQDPPRYRPTSCPLHTRPR